MLPRESISKTKFFLHKTLQNFKSFFFGEYQKLPRSFSFNPFSRRSGNAETYTSEQFYLEFYDQWQSELRRLKMIEEENSIIISGLKSEEPEILENAAESTEAVMGFVKQSPAKKCIEGKEEGEEDRGKEKNQKENLSLAKGNGRGKVQVLIQKMKEMEMMDVDDVEHLLDIEEALHYYSRLKCPVYLDVVDKFFMEMLSEFSVPPRLPEPNS
ncbi:uncharacterized protein LOC114762489 [Neltuma alba]|uniref:uncharacterized protein LOC114715396 n=1 Tax=Neltuma alba TaxID=207710 RepID=UPI0010A31B58|nr:uncharacterized protein LOC114715396 [Prosopis alba]XP_028807817.1 uncharacterized protein LOC114762489 [Prosopis alba]